MPPDQSFDQDITFSVRKGQRTIDGKVNYPTLLRLRLDRPAMWDIVDQLLAELKTTRVAAEIELPGVIGY